MDISDIDIYDDLDDFQEKEEKKSTELLELEAKYKESLETIELMKAEMKTLHKKQRLMEVNFQNLLDTAKTEIKRKNDQIALLQREKDDICFRRKHARTTVAARTTHIHLNDGDGSAANLLSHHQKVNPFKQNATITQERLNHNNSLAIADAAVMELPKELLATTTTATNSKRQLSPIDSDESWKEEDIVESRHKKLLQKKPRCDEHRNHRRAASGSGKDEEATSASNCESSHSRERNSRSYNDARSSSRYKFNKNSRCSDTEDRYNDYQRERSRGRRERDLKHEHHRSRHRSSKSREGREREHHESGYDRRHRNLSRSDLARADHEKYSKKETHVKSSSRSSTRKESLQNTLDARDYAEDSNKKSYNIKYDRHEDKYDRKEQTKARAEIDKKGIHLERADVNKKVLLDGLDKKDRKNPFLENYKIPKIKQEDKQFDNKKFLEKNLKEDAKTISSNRSTSLNDAKDFTEVEKLPKTDIYRNYRQYKNHTDINLVYDDMDAEFSPNGLSNSSSDTILFEIAKDASIKNSDNNKDNNVPNENSDIALNTPKKVALFDALFGQQAGDGTTTNKSSKLLGNVLEVLKNDATKAAVSADNKPKEGEKVLSSDLSKKQNYNTNIAPIAKDNVALDSCLLQSNKSAEIITKSSTQNKSVAKNITKNSAEDNFKKVEVIEIGDDTEIDSTDEEIVFFNIVAPAKHSDITKPDTADLEKTTSEDVSKNVAKVDKTKKPVIEIIEDIRLPTVLPIKQILKKHEETRAQKQQVIANTNTDNLSLLPEGGELQSEENIEYSPNITAFNTDDELDISDQTEIIFDETNMSLEVVSDNQISDLEDIKEGKVNSRTVDNIAPPNDDLKQSNKQKNMLKNVNKSALSATEQECLHKSAIELNNVESDVIYNKLESAIITKKQARPQDGAGAIVYIDIDESTAEKEQEPEKLHNKQDIALITKEKTNETIDSNINTFDMEIEEKQDNFIDKIVSVADISKDIKATLNKEDVNIINNVELFTESAELAAEADQNILISTNNLVTKEIFSNKQAECMQSIDTDQFKEKIIDDKNFVTNDDFEKADENMNQLTQNEIVVKADVHLNKEANNPEQKDTNLQSTEHLTTSTGNAKEKHNLTNTIAIEELEEEKSIDKLENSDEEEKAKTQHVIENSKANEENIKMTQEKNEIATKVSENSAIKNVSCDNLEKDVVEGNNDICENLEKLRDEQENIVSCTDIAINNIKNQEVAQSMPEEEVLFKNNAIEDNIDHNKEKHTLQNDVENAADIEIDAEIIKKIENVLEVGLIEIDADIKELEVDLEVYENKAKKDNDIIKENIVTKDIDKIQETVQPQIFTSCSNDIDVKASTHNKNVPVFSENIIHRYHKTASNKEVNKDLRSTPQDNARHIAQDDWEAKTNKEKKTYEDFKKSVASDVRKATSKSDSKEALKDFVDCSKIATDILIETSITKITTNTEIPKVGHVPSAADQEKLLLQEDCIPPTKQPCESKLKSDDDKMGQQFVDEFTLDNSDVILHAADDMGNEESKTKTTSYKKSLNTGHGEEKIKNISNEHELKTTVPNEALIAKVKPETDAVNTLDHTEIHTEIHTELDHNNKIKELAINQLRELSAIVVSDEKNYNSALEEAKHFSPKVLPKPPKDGSFMEKQPCKKSPIKTKNYFKILVAPKVEAHKRKLPDGYKIPKVKQPKLDDITVDPSCMEKTKNLAKTTAAKFKDHKENLKTKEKEVAKAHKDSSSTAKNSKKINANKTASCSLKTASKTNFGEDKINIPINNNTSTFSMEPKELLQTHTHTLEICDPRNPLYSAMTHTKVGQIKEKVSEKLLELQLKSVHTDIQAAQMPTTNINDHTHSELKSTTENVESQISANTQSPASTAAFITTAKQIKSKHFRRIFDSSSDDEGSDEQNPFSALSQLIADQRSPTAANIITVNREHKRKKTKRRVVRVTTIGEASQKPQHEIPAPSVPVQALPTPVRAPLTPDHAIFHTEPEPSCSYAESALPQFNNLQDKQYTDIDSRLQSMFQSPPYVADHQTALAVNSKHLLSPLYQEASMSPPPAEQNSLNDTGKNASNLETKRLSVGTSQYRVEKVSENVVNVFITRKRHKKKNAILPTNNTAKSELLTSVDAEGIA